ncbi:PucR family transcriptional regulator [Rhodococcus opacus]|uniref:Putative CdaR family transcriptional regulator n=1 Tax=Rhodococcus opacus (strain B4) TaxID=632772 RepID=C1ASA0_RHOOB|nr:helix-turn-helix domain-containing protein [Rhodococcus opacus]BAH48349.1 putative CdaR family transcriptional regulator [Rhodococcus opacus B4]
MTEALWPTPSESVRTLIRDIAESLIPRYHEVVDELVAASLADPRYHEIAADPVLAEADARLSVANLKHWLTSNIADPGRRVPTHASQEIKIYARDVVLRELTTDDVASWRATHRVTWHWWLNECFAATDDTDVLHELVEVSANSLTAFVDDSIAALADYIQAVREELAGGPQLQRYATVELLLHGSNIEPSRAEAQLGYALTGSHVGAIIWADSEEDVGGLEPAAEQIMRACGAVSRLTVVAGTAALWLWMPSRLVPEVSDVADRIKHIKGIRVAFGRMSASVAGFRRTHMDAAAAQRLLARLNSRLSIVRYEDVQLVDLMSADPALAAQYVLDVLGEFADADPVLHQTVLTCVQAGFNRSSAAERLYTHRNTIDRRLARIDELLPKPLASDPAGVVAALTLLNIRTGH